MTVLDSLVDLRPADIAALEPILSPVSALSFLSPSPILGH